MRATAGSPTDDELGAVIADFLRDAGEGRLRNAAGKPYTRAEVRELRAALTHVGSDLGDVRADALSPQALRRLLDRLGQAGLSPERLAGILDALRAVYAYAIGRGLVRTSPLVGLASPEREPPAPTEAVLALGERLAMVVVWAIVIAFALIVTGLALVAA